MLSTKEIRYITGYVQPSRQLEELRRQGFWRARRDRLGQVILERAHYQAVCAGMAGQPAANDSQHRPRVRTL